jgi:hypothetical protein
LTAGRPARTFGNARLKVRVLPDVLPVLPARRRVTTWSVGAAVVAVIKLPLSGKKRRSRRQGWVGAVYPDIQPGPRPLPGPSPCGPSLVGA